MNIVVHVRLYVYFKHFEAKIQNCSVKQVLDELFTLTTGFSGLVCFPLGGRQGFHA